MSAKATTYFGRKLTFKIIHGKDCHSKQETGTVSFTWITLLESIPKLLPANGNTKKQVGLLLTIDIKQNKNALLMTSTNSNRPAGRKH